MLAQSLPHDDLFPLVPIPLDGKVGIDRVGRILSGNREQNTDGADPGIGEPPLKGRLNADHCRTAALPAIDRMAIGPPRRGMERGQLYINTSKFVNY